jgi:tetratricopeptide (TPR) repeat protein
VFSSIKHSCLTSAAAFALALCQVSIANAQPSKTEELNKRIIELYQARKYTEAIPLAQRLLAIRERTLGLNHPDVASALNNLAALYEEQGRYAEAAPLYKRALAIREKALPSDHPDVVHSLNTLADLYNERAATMTPSPSTSGRWRFDKGLSDPTIPKSCSH